MLDFIEEWRVTKFLDGTVHNIYGYPTVSKDVSCLRSGVLTK